MLGGLWVQVRGRATGRFRTHKTGALLAYLAFHAGRSHTRSALIEEFWPGANDQKGRQSLSTALTSIRKLIEPPGCEPGSVLQADRDKVWMTEGAVTTDVATFLSTAKRLVSGSASPQTLAEIDATLELYRGPLLTGYDDLWVMSERWQLHDQYVALLRHAAQILLDQGNAALATSYARSVAKEEPYDEESRQLLARVLHHLGRDREALSELRMLERTLRQEFGANLGPESRELCDVISSAARRARTEPGDAPVEAPSAPSAPRSSEPLQNVSPVPHRATRFFGRDQELEEAVRLLTGAHAWCTIVGPGGVGKTRLAEETARRLRDLHGLAVAYVSLEDLQDGSQVPTTVAEALGFPASAAESPQVLRSALVAAPTVLVLDNAEHVLAGVRWISTELFRGSGFSVLVTSRQPLEIEFEQTLRIEPLPLPEQTCSLASLLENPTVALFVDRAQRSLPDFQLTARNMGAVLDLSAKLEGMPLAIELAAARAQIFSPSQMLEQMHQPFEFLVTKRRPTTQRHRALSVAIEWSYSQLSEGARSLFVQLSVFRGGWTLEVAQEVCQVHDLPSLMEELVHCSLVSVCDGGGQHRFRMLESLRQFGQSQLDEDGAASLGLKHLDYFVGYAESTLPRQMGPEAFALHMDLRHERDNFHASLAYAQDQSSLHGLRLTTALALHWFLCENSVENRKWLDHFLETAECQPPPLRVAALCMAGRLGNYSGEFQKSKRVLTECYDLASQLGNPFWMGSALEALAFTLATIGDYEACDRCVEEGMALATAAADDRLMVQMLFSIGGKQFYEGDGAASLEYLSRAQALAEKIGDPMLCLQVDVGLASAHLLCRQFEQGRDLYLRALEIAKAIGDFFWPSLISWGLAIAAWNLGNMDDAAANNRQHIQLIQVWRGRWGEPHALECEARLALSQGNRDRAVTLFAAADRLRRDTMAPLAEGNRMLLGDLTQSIADIKSAKASGRAWEVGSHMSWQSASDFALSDKTDFS